MAHPRGAWGAGLCAALLLAFASTAEARTLEGRVTHVTDGDTLWVRPTEGGGRRERPQQGRARGAPRTSTVGHAYPK